MWEALAEICEDQGITINEFCGLVDESRGPSSLTAAIRVAIVAYYRELARSGASLPALASIIGRAGPPAAAPVARDLDGES